MQLYVSQSLGAGSAGKNPGQSPRSGEGLFQQRAMSVQLPHPNTAIKQLQARSSPLCQPSSFSVPKLSLCLLISTTQTDIRRLPFCFCLCNFIVTGRDGFLRLGQMKGMMFITTDIVACVFYDDILFLCAVLFLVTWSCVATKWFSYFPT